MRSSDRGPSPEVAYRLQRRGEATGRQGWVTQWDGSLGSSPTGTGAGGWVEWRVSQIDLRVITSNKFLILALPFLKPSSEKYRGILLSMTKPNISRKVNLLQSHSMHSQAKAKRCKFPEVFGLPALSVWMMGS